MAHQPISQSHGSNSFSQVVVKTTVSSSKQNIRTGKKATEVTMNVVNMQKDPRMKKTNKQKK